jgi:hypothetical protein
VRGNYKQISRWGDEGVTITWEHRTTGEVRTAHTPGQPRIAALRAALDGWDSSEWRIRCISSPQTIYDDMTAVRMIIDPGDKDWGRNAEGERFDSLIRHPEPYLLGKVGGKAYL